MVAMVPFLQPHDTFLQITMIMLGAATTRPSLVSHTCEGPQASCKSYRQGEGARKPSPCQPLQVFSNVGGKQDGSSEMQKRWLQKWSPIGFKDRFTTQLWPRF